MSGDSEGTAASTSDPRSVRIRRAGLTPGSAFLVVAAVLAALATRDAFVAAHRTIGWLIACAVVALLIDPLVDLFDRVLPRWLAVIVVLLVAVVGVGAVVAALTGDVADSLGELKASAPEAAAELEQRYDFLADIDLATRVQSFVDDLDDRVRKDAVSAAAATLPTYFVTGILMLFLLAYGRRYFEGFADQFGPARRARIRIVGQAAGMRGRRYLLILLAHSIVNGIVVGTMCWILGLPAERALGFAVAAFTAIPIIGVVVGGIPAALLAFGLEGWMSGVIVVVALVVLQAIEAAVVRPYVDPRTVRVGPTIPIVVALLGFELYGAGGAVYSIALAVIALAALDAVGRLRDDTGVDATSETIEDVGLPV